MKTCVSGNFGSCLKEVKPLVVYDGEQGIALEPMQGIGLNLKLIWATPSDFTFLCDISVLLDCEGFLGVSL